MSLPSKWTENDGCKVCECNATSKSGSWLVSSSFSTIHTSNLLTLSKLKEPVATSSYCRHLYVSEAVHFGFLLVLIGQNLRGPLSCPCLRHYHMLTSITLYVHLIVDIPQPKIMANKSWVLWT